MTDPTSDTPADETEAPKRDENMIFALKRERAAMKSLGKDDRVAQINEQLAYYGHNPDGEQSSAESTAPKTAKAPTAGKTQR